MNKIIPYPWFDNQADEAATFYVSLFRNSEIGNVVRYGEEAAKASGRQSGSVMMVEFRLEGQNFLALNGGPAFTFSPAISLLVNCETQWEIDRLYDGLSAGGEAQPCGWLKDKFGVSWQVVPAALAEMLKGKDPERAGRVMTALLAMKKIDIAMLERAYEEEPRRHAVPVL